MSRRICALYTSSGASREADALRVPVWQTIQMLFSFSLVVQGEPSKGYGLRERQRDGLGLLLFISNYRNNIMRPGFASQTMIWRDLDTPPILHFAELGKSALHFPNVFEKPSPTP